MQRDTFGPSCVHPKGKVTKTPNERKGQARDMPSLVTNLACACSSHGSERLHSLASQARVQYSTQDSEKQQAAPRMRIPSLRAHF